MQTEMHGYVLSFQVSHTKLEPDTSTPSPHHHEYMSPLLASPAVNQPIIQQPSDPSTPIVSPNKDIQPQVPHKPELVKHDSLPDSHRLRIATRGKVGDGSWDEDSAISQTSSTSGYRLLLKNL